MTAALIGWRRETGLYGRMGLKLQIDVGWIQSVMPSDLMKASTLSVYSLCNPSSPLISLCVIATGKVLAWEPNAVAWSMKGWACLVQGWSFLLVEHTASMGTVFCFRW